MNQCSGVLGVKRNFCFIVCVKRGMVNFLKICVKSEVHVKQIRVNQGVGVIWLI